MISSVSVNVTFVIIIIFTLKRATPLPYPKPNYSEKSQRREKVNPTPSLDLSRDRVVTRRNFLPRTAGRYWIRVGDPPAIFMLYDFALDITLASFKRARESESAHPFLARRL